jgi:hypothetical protein
VTGVRVKQCSQAYTVTRKSWQRHPQENIMVDIKELMGELKQTRDELALRVHLASMEVREEWDGLEDQWETFKARADVEQTAEGVGTALGQLGHELMGGYKRLRKALKD